MLKEIKSGEQHNENSTVQRGNPQSIVDLADGAEVSDEVSSDRHSQVGLQHWNP